MIDDKHFVIVNNKDESISILLQISVPRRNGKVRMARLGVSRKPSKKRFIKSAITSAKIYITTELNKAIRKGYMEYPVEKGKSRSNKRYIDTKKSTLIKSVPMEKALIKEFQS